MSAVHLFTGCRLIRNTFRNIPNTTYMTLQKLQFSRKSDSSSSSSSSSSSDDDIKPKEKLDEKKRSKEALEKLNKLLITMAGEEIHSKTKLNLAQPLNKRRKNIEDKEAKAAKPESPEKQIVNAAKSVAESIGGDVQQTQSELLMKLLNVASGEGTTNTKLTDLVKGMKIDQERKESDDPLRAQQVRQIWEKRKFDTNYEGRSRSRTTRKISKTDVVEKIDLFGSEPLGIFTEKQTDVSEGVENKIWNQLYQKDLKLTITHPPSNYFQQLVLWTEQGKIWKFPIDNEQDLEEEKKIYFTEHVFLEQHLEPWCPNRGPLRHFMELVCVGLSKNPYLTVEAKKEHILWFKKYFDEKKQLLRETGALLDKESGIGQSQKQIE